MGNILIQYLKKIDRVMIFSIMLSIITLAISFFTGFNMKDSFVENHLELSFWDIFINNSIVSIMFFLGAITFGLLNFIYLFINGYYIGTTFSYKISSEGLQQTIDLVFWHGLLEVPSLILSSSLGFVPLLLVIFSAHSSKKIKIKKYLKYAVVVILLVFILNALAALIESTTF
ncbi:stage II sporulation protein M [Bacillus pumilus]|nr:stage II sporulation protein M [Bacillus pumilus]MCY7618995.1 stage II sporulation protein M [Bacillus pumilus]